VRDEDLTAVGSEDGAPVRAPRIVVLEVSSDSPVCAFQISTTPLVVTVTSRLASELNATDTSPPECPIGRPSGWPVKASQMRTVLSNDPVTTRSPSGENSAVLIRARCFMGWPIG